MFDHERVAGAVIATKSELRVRCRCEFARRHRRIFGRFGILEPALYSVLPTLLRLANAADGLFDLAVARPGCSRSLVNRERIDRTSQLLIVHLRQLKQASDLFFTAVDKRQLEFQQAGHRLPVVEFAVSHSRRFEDA